MLGLSMFQAARLVRGFHNWTWIWRIGNTSPSATVSPFISSIATKIKKYKKMKNLTEPPNWTQLYQERYIPLSKDQLLGYLSQEFHSSPSEESAIREFAFQAEFHTMFKYKHILTQMQALYYPIPQNPDILHQPLLTDHQCQDKEQELLRALEPLLDQANYSLLSEEVVAFSLSLRHKTEVVKVKANLKEYTLMRFWALGQRKGIISSSTWRYLGFLTKLPEERRYFQRVVMAANIKQAPLVLKSFKDVPLDSLQYLLPGVKARTSRLKLAQLNAIVMVSGLVSFINLGMVAASSLHLATSLLLLFFVSLMGHRTFKVFTRLQKLNNLELINLLYFRTTSSDYELINNIVLRALEEHIKEVLLAHSFLSRKGDVPPEESAQWLQKTVESWVRTRLGCKVSFDGARALDHHKALVENMSIGPLTSYFKNLNPLLISQSNKSLDPPSQIQSVKE
ncbi:transmembrane protein 143 [Monodelphis domestica]|uniref:Transmembrane protein 143 n=1 Tax=Monodelphis domestica TaxID=13616 RepID=F7DBI9_MONDO|nr:transmembrane protein 143 [Monodelphis domestica]